MEKIRKFYPLMPLVAGLTPILAAAADFESIINNIHAAVNMFIPLIMTIAVAVFLYGVVKYITAGGDAEKEKSARGYIIYGIIGLFVLVAFWGLVTVLVATFGLESGAVPVTPTLGF